MATAIQYGTQPTTPTPAPAQAGTVPGVYLEVVTPEPNPAFTTGLPVFFGYGSLAGPELSAPYVVTRIEDLAAVAPFNPETYLNAAVNGFFACGGAECRVVLIDPSTATLGDPAQALIDLWGRAIDSVAVFDEIDLLCAPSLMSTTVAAPLTDVIPAVQQKLLAVCETRGTCFAILDSGIGLPGPAAVAQAAQLGAAEGARSGALYFPWVKPEGAAAFVPPCGHVSGIYSQTDQAIGVHKAPANLQLAGVIDLESVLSDSDQRALAAPSLNVLRALPGRGIRVWGARTLDAADPDWSFVSVRRLFTSLARWLKQLTAWSVFEPNDLRLWIRLTRQLDAYLLQLFSSGGLKGAGAAEAYFIQCDDETNPPEQRDQGRLVVLIGLAPVRPGEFIVIRLTQSKDGAAIAVDG